MCGRYTLIHPTTDILQRFGLTQIKIEGLPVEIEPRANIAPSQLVPAVVNHGFGKEQFRMLDALRWGFLPMWVKDIKKSTKLTITALVGITSRGKYIFEIILALPIMLLPASAKAVAKNCQGSMAAKTMMA